MNNLRSIALCSYVFNKGTNKGNHGNIRESSTGTPRWTQCPSHHSEGGSVTHPAKGSLPRSPALSTDLRSPSVSPVYQKVRQVGSGPNSSNAQGLLVLIQLETG